MSWPLARVVLAFAINGISSSIWISRTPRLVDRLHTTEGRLGVLFAVGAVGGIVGSRVASRAVRGRSPARVMAVAGFGVAGIVGLRAAATTFLVFAVVQLLAGLVDGVHDVSMNSEGVRLDQAGGRSIMNRLHGLWSVGTVVGGVIGAVLASMDVGLTSHFLIAGAVLAIMNVAVLRAFADPPAPMVAVEAGERPAGRVSTVVVVLCVVGVAAALLEGAPNDWGSIYLRNHLGTSEGVAGLTTVAFAVAMVVARLTGDHVVDRFGSMRVLRTGALLAGAGVLIGIGIDRPWSVIVGWAVVGAGVATAFPALFVAGANLPGIAPETGMAALTAVARSGFLIGPIAIGQLVDAAGVRAALLVAVVAAGVMAAGSTWLAREARPA